MEISIELIKAVSFYIFSALAIISALMVILKNNPMSGAMSLVGTFFSLAAIYVLLNSEFIAVMQILVYAGAIMVLVIFVIMLLNLRPSRVVLYGKAAPKAFVGLVFGAILAIGLVAVISMGSITGGKGDITASALSRFGAIQLISQTLFTEYLLAFELTSLLLTVAIVGVVILAKGMRLRRKTDED